MTEEQKLFYGEYSDSIESTLNEILFKLKSILAGISTDPEQVPFEHLISRIKGVDSAREKLMKKGLPADADSALENLSDIIGIRVVTHFVGDIYDILDKISANDSWKVVNVKDYIASPKPNGYRSLHVIIRLPIDRRPKDSGDKPDISAMKGDGTSDGSPAYINAEIQLRTIAMDCWAALEHQMRYKKDIEDTALIYAELKRCADEMASTDLTMQTIRDVLIDDRR